MSVNAASEPAGMPLIEPSPTCKRAMPTCEQKTLLTYPTVPIRAGAHDRRNEMISDPHAILPEGLPEYMKFQYARIQQRVHAQCSSENARRTLIPFSISVNAASEPAGMPLVEPSPTCMRAIPTCDQKTIANKSYRSNTRRRS